jgi:hypothetical protein
VTATAGVKDLPTQDEGNAQIVLHATLKLQKNLELCVGSSCAIPRVWPGPTNCVDE